jgi:hypothetical protein
MPLGCGSGRRTFTPLRQRWGIGRRLRRAAAVRVRRTLGPLDPLATWQRVLPVLLHLGCGLIPSWLLLGRGVHRSRCLHRALVRDVRGVAALTRGWRAPCSRFDRGWGLCAAEVLLVDRRLQGRGGCVGVVVSGRGASVWASWVCYAGFVFCR